MRRRAMLNFVIVGGGPTGVESAGALSELIRLVLTKDYPKLEINDVRVILLEATDRAARPDAREAPPGHGARSSGGSTSRCASARRSSASTASASCSGRRGDPGAHARSGRPACARRRSSRSSACELGRRGASRVERPSSCRGSPNVFVIGDAAYLEHAAGEPLPMMAPVAQQQADHAARNIGRALAGAAMLPFRYANPGTMATIGRNAAVVARARPAASAASSRGSRGSCCTSSC